MSLSLILGPS